VDEKKGRLSSLWCLWVLREAVRNNVKEFSMKKLFALIALAVGSVQAAPVTIDFESGTVDYFNSDTFVSTVGSQGFEVTGDSFAVGDAPEAAGLYTGNNGTVVYGASACCVAQDGFSPAARFSLRRADGGAFSLFAVDFYGEFPNEGIASPDSTSIIGRTVSGENVFLSSTALGTGGWLNLEFVQFYSGGNGNSSGYALGELDNIVVSAVPVPAAVWLFGSALAGLGWLRRP